MNALLTICFVGIVSVAGFFAVDECCRPGGEFNNIRVILESGN